MVFAYLSLGLIAVFALHMLLRFLTTSKPATIRRAGKIVFISAIILLVFFLLRFGLTHLAAIVSFISVITPLIRRLSHSTASASGSRTPPAGRMTVEQARAILGVDAHASAATIRETHRLLIQKNHPDAGGTEYLASQINEARDVLLRHLKEKP